MSTKLNVFLPLQLAGRGPSYTCGMLAKGIADVDFAVTIFTPRARELSVSPADIVEILPSWARHRYIPFRWVRSLAMRKIEEAFLSRSVKSKAQVDGAYIWPDPSLKTVNELKRSGILVFREMINCHRGTAKRILDDAYRRLGVPPGHTITEESVLIEQKLLEAVDYIFCPSAMVEASLLENGLPPSKSLSATYGWDPARLSGKKKLLKPSKGITAVFVGNICVRKGAHLLLEYWAESRVQGRLVLAGAMEPIIKKKCAHLLARDDVVVLNYVSDVGAFLRSADVFVFPSLEEGAPLVTYEACGCGLPVITTPMGTARIVRHEQEGFVLNPYDSASWITAICLLAEDTDRRLTMGAAASERAQAFQWNAVAVRRRQQILDCLVHRSDAVADDV